MVRLDKAMRHRVTQLTYWVFDGSLKLDTWFATLTLRAFPLEYVAPVGAIDVAARWFQAFHAVSLLQVIISGTPAMAAAALIVAIDVPDLSCRAIS